MITLSKDIINNNIIFKVNFDEQLKLNYIPSNYKCFQDFSPFDYKRLRAIFV